jgi:hypothetical protein
VLVTTEAGQHRREQHDAQHKRMVNFPLEASTPVQFH